MIAFSFYILSNPDESNSRGIKSPFWNRYKVGFQIEIVIRRLLAVNLENRRIYISIPDDYQDCRLQLICAKYGIALHTGPRNLKERESVIIKNMMPEECVFLFRAEDVLVDSQAVVLIASRLLLGAREVCVSGAIPGTVPYCAVSGCSRERKDLIELHDLEQWRYGVEVSDVEKIRTFSWLTEELADKIFTINVPALGHFLKSNRYKVLFFGCPIPPEFVDLCDNCHGRLEPLPLSHTLPINSFIPQDIPYYFQCPQCGLVHLNPRPPENMVSLLYGINYAEFRESKSTVASRWDWRRVIETLPGTCGALLDVGGGSGAFGAALPYGWRYDLCEIDPEAAALAEKRCDFLYVGGLDTIPRVKTWEVMTFMQVIEHQHFKSFIRYLSTIPTLLKTGGKVYFSTPNYHSTLHQVFGLQYAAMPYHIHLYSENCLRGVLSAKMAGCKIEIEKGNHVGLPGWATHWARSALTKELRELALNQEWLFAQRDDCLLVSVSF